MARGQKAAVGDTRVSPNGYHYTKTEEKWELTHRLVIEQHLGRPLAANERCRFKSGFSKEDFDKPEAIEVYIVKESTAGAELARLYHRRDEIQARIDELEAQDS